MKKKIVIFFIFINSIIFSQNLQIPPRLSNALKGSDVVKLISPMSRDDRENEILKQVSSGNVPEFFRKFYQITITMTLNSVEHTINYFVSGEYLLVGSDDDYFLIPLSPIYAQRIADLLNCTMPSRKMVNDIYQNASVKLRPQPIAPSSAMITVPVFKDHNDSVLILRTEKLAQFPLGSLVGGHKKDVIISNLIYNNLKANVPKPVVIYGWHQLNGTPIQPAYNGHEETYADYSHGIRLVQTNVIVDGVPRKINDIFMDPTLSQLISDEGVISNPKYNYLSYLLPSTPKIFGISANENNVFRIRFTKPIDTLKYTLYISNDGINFNDSIKNLSDNQILSGLKNDSLY